MTAVEVHVEVQGPRDRPVVILSPSLGSTRRMWDPQISALTEHFHVVRYDPRGHGLSPVPPGRYDIEDLGADLLALMDRLSIERAHLVGLSLGGMTAMWIGARAPERVASLALLCTSARMWPRETWIERARVVREQGTQAVAAQVVARWFTPAWADRHPDVVSTMQQMVSATPAEGYASCCGAIERMDLIDDLRLIAAPTLVIAGAEDPSAPVDPHAKTIAHGISTATLEVIPSAAHLANVEQPEIVNALLLQHLLAHHREDQR